MYFEVYLDNQRFYRWRLKAANHEVIAVSSESYNSKQSCLYSISLVKSCANAAVKDLT